MIVLGIPHQSVHSSWRRVLALAWKAERRKHKLGKTDWDLGKILPRNFWHGWDDIQRPCVGMYMYKPFMNVVYHLIHQQWFQTHSVIIRKNGAFPSVSAFPFEDLYSTFKKNYADGTFNKPKQVLWDYIIHLLILWLSHGWVRSLFL